MYLLIGVLYFKFLLFDLIWAIPTTFSAFQFPIGWLLKLTLATLLAAPLILVKRKWYMVAIGLMVDVWLTCNLMYFRNYYTVIPLQSYLLAGNLADFKASVYEALRWCDLLFPLTTAAMLWMVWRVDVYRIFSTWARKLRLWLKTGLLFFVPLIASIIVIVCQGGYKKAYEKTLYDYSMVIGSIYTIPGTWIYSIVAAPTELTPEIEAEIQDYLSQRPQATDSIPPVLSHVPRNCIIILCESLESWPIGAVVDGHELTPNLNRLIQGENVLYAPHMLTQVRDARSIDAQLFIHTGLMPVSYGAYSYRFPHTQYFSLDKAWKEKYPGGKTYSFTVDKNSVWNAAIAAQDFGIDELLDKRSWSLDQVTGPRGRLGDESFLRQAYDKLAQDDHYFPASGHTMVQIVTYSGHTPFKIPEELKGIHFSAFSPMPERLRHYMETANYTDRAIGEFVSKIQANPKTADAMIVITGDHEGMGIDRGDYLKVPGVSRFLSPEQFTPFIVLNSPVSGQREAVMGQVDMYPTLLDLLGLNDYEWRGLGSSIVRENSPEVAADPRGKLVGNSTRLTPEEINHLKDAYRIGDLIIQTDYFKNRSR